VFRSPNHKNKRDRGRFLQQGEMMKTTTVLVLGALAGVAATADGQASAASASCDRECLRGAMTTFLYALVEHDASKVPVADVVRVTEDGIEKPLAKVGLLSTVTRLRGYRQDILDERAGMAGADVVVEEVGAPVMLVVRLKVVDRRITEIETVATRSRSDGLIFNIDGLSAPSERMNYAPPPEQLASREDAIKAAMHYPTGLNAAKTFAAVSAPFAPNAYRYENGQLMAGPDCKFAPGCENIATQSLAIRATRGRLDARDRRRRADGDRLAAHGVGRA
jgi:hypothetical protein